MKAKIIILKNSLLRKLLIFDGFAGRTWYNIIFIDGTNEDSEWMRDIITHEIYHYEKQWKGNFFKYPFLYMFNRDFRKSVEYEAYSNCGPKIWRSEITRNLDMESFIDEKYDTYGAKLINTYDILHK